MLMLISMQINNNNHKCMSTAYATKSRSFSKHYVMGENFHQNTQKSAHHRQERGMRESPEGS